LTLKYRQCGGERKSIGNIQTNCPGPLAHPLLLIRRVFLLTWIDTTCVLHQTVSLTTR